MYFLEEKAVPRRSCGALLLALQCTRGSTARAQFLFLSRYKIYSLALSRYRTYVIEGGEAALALVLDSPRDQIEALPVLRISASSVSRREEWAR